MSRYWKHMNFPSNLALIHSDSTNIGRIATANVGGARAAKTAQSTY